MKYENLDSFKGPTIEIDGLAEELNKNFPWLDAGFEEVEIGTEIAQTSIGVANFVGASTQVKRIPNGPDGERENIAEHSYMLTLITPRIARRLGIDAHAQTIVDDSLLHDAPEIIVGDKNTFNLTPQELEEKEKADHEATNQLKRRLPGWMADRITTYERQDTEGAIFVRAVDKLLPLAVNIAHEDLTVVRRDFDITSLEELENNHRLINQSLMNRFGQKWLKTIVIAHAIECLMYEDVYRLKSTETLETRRDPNETKRRFLITPEDLPHDLDSNPNIFREEIRQFYPQGEKDGSSTRIRSYDNTRFTMLNRAAGTIQRKKGDEIPLYGLTPESFEAWHRGAGVGMIEKTKYHIPYGNIHMIELGIYHGTHEGIIIAAIKFKGRDALAKSNLLEVPQWFGKEITNNSSFFGHMLGDTSIHELSE